MQNYLKTHPGIYNPECHGVAEITQYSSFENGKYHFAYDVGECING